MDPMVVEAKKTLCIVQLTETLPALRASLGLSQEAVANRIGISRQTYSAIETKKRPLSWNICISLTSLFASHKKSLGIMKNNSDLLELLDEVMQGK